jgi:hypothetical protein
MLWRFQAHSPTAAAGGFNFIDDHRLTAFGVCREIVRTLVFAIEFHFFWRVTRRQSTPFPGELLNKQKMKNNCYFSFIVYIFLFIV